MVKHWITITITHLTLGLGRLDVHPRTGLGLLSRSFGHGSLLLRLRPLALRCLLPIVVVGLWLTTTSSTRS